MGEKVLRKTQAALEVTRGTDLAATRKVYGIGKMVENVPPIFPSDQEERGTFVNHYRSQTGLIEAGMDFGGPVTYEDLPWWLQLALKGGVTGVLSAVTVYTYTFVPTQATDDLKTATLEWGDETQAFESHFAAVDQMEISGALGEQLKFTANIIVDDWSTGTFTGSIADRATEDALMHLTKFAVGAAGAVPAGYIAGRLISFKFTIMNHLTRKYFADGAGAKYTGIGRGKREYKLEITMEGNAATITEWGILKTGVQRVVRLTTLGSIIAGSTGNVVRSIDIIIPGVWSAFPVGERDTNTTFTGTLEAEYDSVLGYDLSVAVANALAALP